MPKKDELTQRHKNFVDAYILNGGCGTDAYLDVYGGTRENAANRASILLRSDKVREYLDRRNKELDVDKILDLRQCLTLLNEIANDKDNEKVSTGDRLSAIDKRLKTMGAYLDRKQVTAEVENKITITIGEEEED